MKISKKQPVNANTELAVVEQQPVAAVPESESSPACVCKYDNAINLISAAIESLAVVAKDDEVARDSIANLGVVLFDLKGNCCI